MLSTAYWELSTENCVSVLVLVLARVLVLVLEFVLGLRLGLGLGLGLARGLVAENVRALVLVRVNVLVVCSWPHTILA